MKGDMRKNGEIESWLDNKLQGVHGRDAPKLSVNWNVLTKVYEWLILA